MVDFSQEIGVESDKIITHALIEKLKTLNVRPDIGKNDGIKPVAMERKVKHRSHK